MAKIYLSLAATILILFSAESIALRAGKTMHMGDSTVTVTKQQKQVYTCPMHPEVISDQPGDCAKCGMKLILQLVEKEEPNPQGRATTYEVLSPKEKILRARALLKEAKQDLAQGGSYSCCIKDPCDRCALDHQNCRCAADLKAGKAVCPDCYAGWQRGDGALPGIKPGKVKGSFHGH